MKVILTESQYKLLREFKKKITFYSFYCDALDFLRALLKNPGTAKVSERLEGNGITSPKLIKALAKNKILKRVPDKVQEVPIGEDSESEPIIIRKYIVLKPDFEPNLRKTFKMLTENVISKDIIEDDKTEDIEECDCGGVMQGGTANPNPSAGTYDVPFSGMVTRSVYQPKTNKKRKKKKK